MRVRLIYGSSEISPRKKFGPTCIGVLSEDSAVNPQISEKYMVTESKASASTCLPSFNCSATDLK